jgi:hypothetical protein
VIGCKVGVNIQGNYYHGAQIDHAAVEWTPYAIGSVDPSSGLANPSGASGYSVFNIDMLDIEDAASGWGAPVFHIYDPGNDYAGVIRYVRVLAGVGTQTGALTVSGGSGLLMVDLTDIDYGGSAAHPDLATHDTLGLATQAELDAHAATSHAGGEILISDTPAGTPLVFADLLQNEAQDDLLYSD